ncbi:butyrophilin subfamily 1 member A1-like [Pleurodeles waltl]|uniref:butyrophilin subfamily 1 member A1-like n=1 Tax=Pleurodeles waltl TaxID=8319 RepID=UPI003709A375
MAVWPWSLCLVILLLCISTSRSDIGSDPHIHIEGYQDSGIKITCTSERWDLAPELLWQDDGGKNLSAASENINPDEDGLLKVETSFIVSSNKKVSCLLRAHNGSQDREATLYIAETFFHRVSRCSISCPLIGLAFALMLICLTMLAVFLFKQQKASIDALKEKIRNLKDELEWRRSRTYDDDVILDPNTASARLAVSDDRKSVQPRPGDTVQTPNNPEVFDRTMVVLGSEEFTSGKHYWEVKLNDKTGWSLGVLEEDENDIITSHLGLSLYNNKYKSISLEKNTQLTVGGTLTKVGVFVDYAEKTVSFYSVDSKAKLCSLSSKFTKTIKPFLNPGDYSEGENGGALEICTVPEWD